ncbi:MAG: hypothetical protein II295_05870 [Akkermansia sp.]|nr:hypothetical protein [Akkermansia sp.]
MNIIKTLLAVVAMATPSLMAAPMPPKADLLASNTVVAVYAGTKEQPCLFRTARCPHRCGHATKVAMFNVVTNEEYSKPGEYGDDKAEPGSMVLVDMLKDTPGQSEDVKKLISSLETGDTVRLTQAHYYGDFGDVMEPFRPITKIEKIDAPKAAAPRPQMPQMGRGLGAGMLRRAR